ncbi:MAG: bifunctional oligoribonuclease/PAP phosphatase NrnA [Clostridioides sp.]|jgi:phosphoesterase RecJ-like protein|nr:bifunctional oligoribonuclease/PAP phosphatase NrnA [Clostridioides sp.]
MINIDRVIDCIVENENFVVTSHVSPDGDNLGSSMAMYHALEKLGKKVNYVLDDVAPLNLEFITEGVKKLSSDEFESQGDYIVIALDCGDEFRICIDEDILKGAKALVNIDHHDTNRGYADINAVDSKASSTCEMVYRVLNRYKKIYKEGIIDSDVATCLYTGLVTDTGNFQYSNADEDSFDMARNLIAFGARKQDVVTRVFQSNSLNFYRLLGDALNTLEVFESKIASMCITTDMLSKNEISSNDIDGVTPYTRDIEGIEIGILFKQKGDKEFKISLRSKNTVEVSQIAKKFGGGGHVYASGCTVHGKLEDVKEMVISEAVKALDDYYDKH